MKDTLFLSIMKRLAAKYLPQNLVLFLKKMYNHKPEIIFNLIPRQKHLPKNIDVTYERYAYIRQLVMEIIDVNVGKTKMNLLNVGCGDGIVTNQFFTSGIYEEHLSQEDFFNNFNYYTNDIFDLDLNDIKKRGGEVFYPSYDKKKLIPAERLKEYPDNFHTSHLKGDISQESFLASYQEYLGFFDVIYSSDVFEHVENPFNAARNILCLLKEGGICITISPFSYPYHPDPEDYFRFTHRGLAQVFEYQRDFKTRVLEAGYDITDRRDNSKGDSVPIDNLGGWRENWMALCAIQKLRKADL